jgi:hypothetical protein
MLSFFHPLCLRIYGPEPFHSKKWPLFSTSTKNPGSFRQFMPISPSIPAIRQSLFPLFNVPYRVD